MDDNGSGAVTCRRAQRGEQDAIRRVVLAAFGPEEEVVADLVESLRGSPAGVDDLSFVAELDGELVGYVLFTRSLLDAPRRLVDVLVLSPLGVVPEHQGRGIGSALARHALAALAERPEPLVFLEGSPSYYSRLGFAPAGDLGFRKPSLRIPDAAFQVRTTSSYEPWMTGTLVYAEPFWRLDCVGLRDREA
jgi:putative acetyltransferase